MIVVPGFASVTLRNLLFNVSQSLTCEGLALVLNQRPWRWTPWAAAAFTLVFWTASQLWLPEEQSLPLRVIASSLFTLLVDARMARLILADRIQSRLWRILILTFLAVLMISALVRMVISTLHFGEPLDVFNPQQGWFYFVISMGVNVLFLCILGAIGNRKAHSLQEHNQTLAQEIELQERLTEEATQALRQQARLYFRRRQFLRQLDHEINTPLAAIDRSAEMLEIAPETLTTRLATIRASVQRLSRLVSGLVTAEQVSLDQTEPALLDANDLIRAAVHEVGERSDIDIRPSLCAAQFLGDPILMQMALTNLLTNARKFSPPGHPVVVSAHVEQNMVRIAVRDRGIGFPPGELHAIGQQGYRASNAREIPGHGLGLHIVSQIVEMHQGRLDVANHPDGGGLVALLLPLSAAT